ncbi:phospholipase D family protein [Falsiroseomonas sp. CW058]|uniref:phospholipase D family protein n=1 Tax=Falsiroseomonas sp. CW058 TaxID=3388664 RepID=UPI003D3178F7
MSDQLTRSVPAEAAGKPPPGTRLERAVQAALASLGARAAVGGVQSGIALVTEGPAAFAVRAATARAAGRSLDLQYYVWRGDVTGQLLAREVLAAAERGVAVRMLLDDVYALGRERVLAALDTHPNIEVRLFNSFRWRAFGRFGFFLEMLLGGRHLNRRMHNKNWIADGRVAIVGGRNIGDEYFGLDTDGAISFRDLDLVIAGPAAEDACQVFARYWASPLARPACLVAPSADARGGLARLRGELAEAVDRPGAAGLLAPLRLAPGRHIRRGLSLAPDGAVRVIADPPEKARRGLGARRAARAAGGIAPEIADALRGAKREALLISPYFVPGRAGLALLLELRGRGVHVAVVTNSLAATDVVAVHGGYSKYRRDLLRAGVELFELKPGPVDEEASVLGSRGAALHTKAFVVDGLRCFVGSFNLDPRSAMLNTEMGAFAQQAGLARQVAAEHARLSDPALSWRVVLEDGRLGWRDELNGATRTLMAEPVASFWRRAVAGIARRLPIEEQL